MNEPVGRNSPVGADFETWSWYTHQAPDKIFVSQAFERHTVNDAAYYNVAAGTGMSLRWRLMTVEAAPP